MGETRITGSDGEQAVPIVLGFHEPGVNERLSRNGFVRHGPLLSSDEVAAARAIFDQGAARLHRPLGEEWFPTITLPEETVRNALTRELTELVTPRLSRVIDTSILEIMRLDYSVKPASPNSELGPHQDFSLVDESRGASLYLWIPLEDVNERNGTLHVVPGSHLFANRIRSQHVPAVFDEVLPLVRREAMRLDCRAGELIIMVSGVIHFSPPNLSKELRLAAHGIVKPISLPLVFYYADEATPPGHVECYEVDMETYIRHIAAGRPGSDVALTRTVERPPPSMSEERFRVGMASARRLSR